MNTRRTSPIVLAAHGTADATIAGVKTVTRRRAKPGRACRWKPGRPAHVYRREPRSGARPFGLVEIVSVRQERLGDITDDEVSREGFPGQTREWFLRMFAELHGGAVDEDALVWRVEYRWRRAVLTGGVCCWCGYAEKGSDDARCPGPIAPIFDECPSPMTTAPDSHCDHWWYGPDEEAADGA